MRVVRPERSLGDRLRIFSLTLSEWLVFLAAWLVLMQLAAAGVLPLPWALGAAVGVYGLIHGLNALEPAALDSILRHVLLPGRITPLGTA